MSFKNIFNDVVIENPTEKFLEFCLERHSVFKKKEAGLPKPWTNDEILQKHKFTNLFRDLDRVSVFIFDWIEPLKDDIEPLFANLLYARNCNKTSTLEKTGWIIDADGKVQDEQKFLNTIEEIGGVFTKGWKNSVWGGAYMVAGTFGPKLGYRQREQMIINYIPKKIAELTQIILDHNCNPDITELLDKLCEAWGYRNLMVFTQWLLDIAHIRPDILPPTIRPPVLSGVEPLHVVFGINDPEELIAHAQQAWNDRYPDERRMEFKDAEHALCEFRKYTAWKLGIQRPKPYKPHHLKKRK